MSTRNAEYIERYKQLIRVLKELPPHEKRKHFNMKHWAQLNECGTACCAAGFAAMDIWFRKRGLTLKFEIESEGHPSRTADLLYHGKRDWNALTAFFGPSVDNTGDSDDVFEKPRSVEAVIKAAGKRISELRKEQTKDTRK